jgi:hypothetical protein
MNRKTFFSVTSFLAFFALIFIGAFKGNDDDTFFHHKVKKGETVSLLCIESYGYYSNDLGVAVAKDNPSIKDINLIFVGQKIQFRKPVTDTAKTAVKDSTEAEVFCKKVAATQGVVTYVEGSAKLIKKGKSTSEKLLSNVVVHPGDVIKTGDDGRVELIINRESVVRLKENTELTIQAFRDLKKNEGKTSLNFSLGSIWSKMKKFKDKISRFELELPTAIAGVHGTIYQTTVNGDKSAQVKVYDGEVAVSGKKQKKSTGKQGLHEINAPHQIPGPHQVSMEEWTRIVRAMQSITIDQNGIPSDPTTFKKAPDDNWEQWNEERDIRIAEMFLGK